MLNNTGGNEGFTIKVEFHGGTMWQDTFSIATDADRRAWAMLLWLANLGSASSQQLGGWVGFSDATPPTFGLGNAHALFNSGSVVAAGQTMSTPIAGVATVDTSAGGILRVQCQPSINSASLSMRKKYGLLELC
jgi:hypothetical protein